MQGWKKAAAALAVVGTLVLGSAQPAAATEAVTVMTGTFSPDPLFNPPTITLSMTGTAAGVFGPTLGTCSATFNATATGNALLYRGSGSFNCNGSYATGGSFSISCSVNFMLVALTALSGSGTCSGSTQGFTLAAATQVASTTISAEGAFAVVARAT